MVQAILRPAQQRSTGLQPVSIAPSRCARSSSLEDRTCAMDTGCKPVLRWLPISSGGAGWRINGLILLRNAAGGAIPLEVRCLAW